MGVNSTSHDYFGGKKPMRMLILENQLKEYK
jgi:hypothetical protein